MIYALHIIIITYIYFARCECVVWDKTEYLLSGLLPACAGSIIQKNNHEVQVVSLLAKKRLQKAFHPRGTSTAEFMSHQWSLNNNVSLFEYLGKKMCSKTYLIQSAIYLLEFSDSFVSCPLYFVSCPIFICRHS